MYWTQPGEVQAKEHVKIEKRRLDSLESLTAFLQDYQHEPLPSERPRWQLLVLPEYCKEYSVLACKMSHAYGDGMSLVHAFFSAFDDYTGFPPRFKEPSWVYTLSVWLFLPLYILAYGVKYAALHHDANAIRQAPLKSVNCLAFSQVFSIEEMKAVAKKRNASVNELVLTIVINGIDDYLREKGLPRDRSINIAIPVNLTDFTRPHVVLRQDLSMLAVPFTYVPNPGHLRPTETNMRQLQEVSATMSKLKTTRLPAATRVLFEYIYYVFGTEVVSRLLLFLNKRVTAVVSNMAGPVKPLHLCGNELVECLPIVPTFSTLVCNLAMFSYQMNMRISCTVDQAAVPDPAALLKHIEANYRSLL